MNMPVAPGDAEKSETVVVREWIPRLSKSRFLSGLQCHKRLWLECYARELATPPDAAAQAIFDTGSRVGTLARDRFAGGVLVEEDHFHHEEAVRRTRTLMTDPAVAAIYEAAFTHDGVRVRVDILVRAGDDAFDLVEVKSSTSAKDEHEPDLALQVWVVEGTGACVRRACLMHLDGKYVYPGGDYDLEALFAIVDMTERVRRAVKVVPRALGEMRDPLWRLEPPRIPTGRHCSDPWECPFTAHCRSDEPEHPIRTLPRARWALVERFAEAGIRDIREIPPDTRLSALQRRAREAIRSGARFIAPAIRKKLRRVGFPVAFLDFETFMPALPLYARTRPYQTICFQWSANVLHEDGSVSHAGFLHDGNGDPRPRFVETLIEELRGDAPIVVYSGYEERCLTALEEALPSFAPELTALRARLFDILPVIRRHVYDPAFRGSFSLKKVLPALLPDLGYDDLDIQNGAIASLAWTEIIDAATTRERAEELRRALLAYCRRDTEALVGLWRMLSDETGEIRASRTALPYHEASAPPLHAAPPVRAP